MEISFVKNKDKETYELATYTPCCENMMSHMISKHFDIIQGQHWITLHGYPVRYCPTCGTEIKFNIMDYNKKSKGE